jgi:hypothetical protein
MSLPLLDLIKLTHDAGALDPRNRVFGLLGLIGLQENLQLTPDYKLSPCKVFCGAIQAIAKDTKRSEEVIKPLLTSDHGYTLFGLKATGLLESMFQGVSCVIVLLALLDHFVSNYRV